MAKHGAALPKSGCGVKQLGKPHSELGLHISNLGQHESMSRVQRYLHWGGLLPYASLVDPHTLPALPELRVRLTHIVPPGPLTRVPHAALPTPPLLPAPRSCRAVDADFEGIDKLQQLGISAGAC